MLVALAQAFDATATVHSLTILQSATINHLPSLSGSPRFENLNKTKPSAPLSPPTQLKIEPQIFLLSALVAILMAMLSLPLATRSIKESEARMKANQETPLRAGPKGIAWHEDYLMTLPDSDYDSSEDEQTDAAPHDPSHVIRGTAALKKALAEMDRISPPAPPAKMFPWNLEDDSLLSDNDESEDEDEDAIPHYPDNVIRGTAALKKALAEMDRISPPAPPAKMFPWNLEDDEADPLAM